MVQLTASYSKALVALIRADEAPIDGIEVGPWFSPKEIKGFQTELPGWEFHFHAGSFISRVRYWPRSLKRLGEYQACTQSRWVSVHIEILPFHVYLLNSLWGWNLNPSKHHRTRRDFLRALERVKAAVDVPIILENLPSLPGAKYAYAADPDIITEIVEAADSGLLLDIAHARVAAGFQGMDIHEYLNKLPLARVEQVHVSGAREKEGYLRDAHESLQAEDYAILKWVLGRSDPKMVTLEYFRDREALREQLWNLREIVGG